MTFWKKRENIIIISAVILFFISLAVWHDICGVCNGFFSFGTPQNFSEIKFINEQEQPLTLANFKGKPIIVNFWATWCPVCVQKMGTLNNLAERFRAKGGEVIAVSRDHSGISAVRSFLARNDYKNLDIYMDPTGKLIESFEARGLPTAILINAQGKEVGRIEGGFDWDSQDAKLLILDKLGVNIDG